MTKGDYAKDEVEAARSVIIELHRILSEYSESVVMIGGWVPALLLPGAGQPHTGSTDVDLALDHTSFDEEGYKTIETLLLDAGYERGRMEFQFVRQITSGDRTITVEVDLLSGEYGGTGRRRRHQRISGILARKARGSDLAFGDVSEVTVEGKLPGGAKDSVTVRVVSLERYLVLKGMAIAGRLKEKDAWDIYYVLRNYPGGVDVLVESLRAHVRNKLVREGLEKIAKAFASDKDVGPIFVADFEEITDPEEREFLQRDAYERVDYLLKELGIV